jgi:hypothetical protein
MAGPINSVRAPWYYYLCVPADSSMLHIYIHSRIDTL